MTTHRRKVVEVEARKWTGGTLNVVHHVKGEQSAKKGDWLVGSEKGEIEVVKDIDFQRDYEPIEEPEPEPDTTLEENVIGNADGGYKTTGTSTEE